MCFFDAVWGLTLSPWILGSSLCSWGLILLLKNLCDFPTPHPHTYPQMQTYLRTSNFSNSVSSLRPSVSLLLSLYSSPVREPVLLFLISFSACCLQHTIQHVLIILSCFIHWTSGYMQWWWAIVEVCVKYLYDLISDLQRWLMAWMLIRRLRYWRTEGVSTMAIEIERKHRF